MEEFLAQQFWHNSLLDYLSAVLIVFWTVVLVIIIKRIFLVRLEGLVKRFKSDWDDFVFILINEILNWKLILSIGLFIAMRTLVIDSSVFSIINKVLLALIVFWAAISVVHVVSQVSAKISRRYKTQNKAADTSMLSVAEKLIQAIIWIFALFFILQNIVGYDVSALIAGVSIGGVALAFALQKIFQDIFSALSIHFDQPFKVGDTIEVGSDKGVVKSIGLRSTHLGIGGSNELIIANKDLSEARIKNYGSSGSKKINIKLNLTYTNSSNQIKKLSQIASDAIKKFPGVRLQKAALTDFLEKAMQYEIVYIYKTSEEAPLTEVKEAVLLYLLESFEHEKITLL